MTVDDQLLLDYEHLSQYTDGDPVEEEELLTHFLTNSAEIITEIENAYRAQDAAQWRMYTHKLKGSAATLGANRLASASAQAEQQWEAGTEAKSHLLERIMLCDEELHDILDVLRVQLSLNAAAL